MSFFQFEADFIESLRCIPMQVRFKLDTCGIKLKLNQWHQFSQADRQALVEQACTTPDEIQAYRSFLHQLVRQHTGDDATELAIADCPDWLNGERIPESVQEKAIAVQAPLRLDQWQSLEPLQRFVLIKLSRSGHENHNFLPAMTEFQLHQP